MTRFFFYLFIATAVLITEINCGDEEDCEENSEFNACGTACPEYCGKPASEMCTMNCVAGCECSTGYKLDPETNKCIKCP